MQKPDENNREGYITLINVSHDEKLMKDEISMQVFKLDQRLAIIHYKTFDNNGSAWGNAFLWDKIMKSIKMPFFIKFKNAWSDFKIRFIRSCKKRIEFFTKKYKYNIDETH